MDLAVDPTSFGQIACMNCQRPTMIFALYDVPRFGPMCPICYKAWQQGNGNLGDEHEEFHRLRRKYGFGIE